MRKMLSLILMTSALTAAGSESVLARTQMPNRAIPQCEIRLIERDTESVVQTAIDSRFPDKVQDKIAASEAANWKTDPDAQRYLAALKDAFAEYKLRRKTDPKTILTIDFAAGPGGDRVDFLFATLWRTLPLGSAYVRQNQEFILNDAFKKQAAPLIQSLRQLHKKEGPDET